MSAVTGQESRDGADMWVDLLIGHLAAEATAFGVTRRAELYVRVAGLPLAKVLDALCIDEAGWAQRLADLRACEARNRAAYKDTP